MHKRGNLYILEGAGGSGKTTLLSKIEKHLKSLKVNVVSTREPGGEESAELIRTLIFKLTEKKLANADQQLALFFAARYLWVQKVVQPNLEKGKMVLSDRSFPTTCAFQGYGGGGK